MMTEHKATPEPWQADAARWLDAIVELRARVEALEANSKSSSNSPQIGSSLVERVGAAIFEQFENNAGNEAEARAAIREVAAWMRENEVGYNAVRWIEQEIDR